MSPRPLRLVATERHVASALAEGARASTFASFLAAVTATGPRPATPEMTCLATAIAVSAADVVHPGGGHLRAAGQALVGALDDALGVLRRAGIDGAQLRRASHPRVELLGKLLERTDEMLASRGIFDDRAMGWVAARAIEVADANVLPSSIEIDGLFQWDPSQLAWVEALARRVPVTVRMPHAARGSHGTPAAPGVLLSLLEGRWQSLPRAPELELYDVGMPERATLIEAATDGAEARAIAGVVSDALSRGAAAEQIAVVVPDLDEGFLERLRAAFDEARIAFSEPRGRPPVASPGARAALGWLDLAAAPLSRDALLDLLRTRAVDPAPFIEHASVATRRRRALELASRLARIPVRTDRDGKLLRDVLAVEIAMSSDDAWMRVSLEHILRERAELAKEAPRAHIAEKLADIWRAMRLGDPDAPAFAAFIDADPASREGQLAAAQLRDAAAGWRALTEALERVKNAATVLGVAEQSISPAVFRSELDRALAAVLPSGTHRPGAVRVARVNDVACLPTDVLVLARASEGLLESDGRNTDPIVDDSVTGTLPPSRRPFAASHLAAARQTAWLTVLARATNIVVTRPETDADGRPLAPALLFRELAAARIPSPETAELRRMREPASRVHPNARLLSRRAADLVGYGAGAIPDDDDVRRRVCIEDERLAFFLDPGRRGTDTTGSIPVDDTVREHLQRAFGGVSTRPIAATAIERAAQCRFSVFAARVLGASSAETLGEGLEPWQRGSLIHRALLEAFEAVRDHRGAALANDRMEVGSAAARKALLSGRSSPLYRAEVERALRDVAAVLRWSLENDTDFRFAYGERTFGNDRSSDGRGEASWPSLAIGSGPSTVYVKGRIDRVDISRDGARARVIDYKTSAPPAWKDVGSLLFQPPLYAYVVLQQMGRLSAPEIRALYLDTSKRPPRMLPAEKQVLTFETMMAAERRAAHIVGRLWQGDVAPRPADAAVCSQCDVRDVCRRPAAMPIEELEQDDGAGT